MALEETQRLQALALSQTTYQLAVQLKQKIYYALPRLQESAYFAWDGLEEFRALAIGHWEDEQIVLDNLQARNDSSLQRIKSFESALKKSDLSQAMHGYFFPIDVKMRSGQNAQRDILGVFSFQDRVILSIFDANLFFALIDPFKNEQQNLFLWTSSGFAVTHSTAEYFAKSFASDPLFQTLWSLRAPYRTDRFQLENRMQVVASFHKIEGTNLMAVSSRDFTVAGVTHWLELSQILILGFGVFLFLSLVSLIVFAKIEKQWARSLLVASAALRASQEEKVKLQSSLQQTEISPETLLATEPTMPENLNSVESISADILQKHELEKKNVALKASLVLALRYLGEITYLQKALQDFDSKMNKEDKAAPFFARVREAFDRLRSLNTYVLKKLDEPELKSNFTRLQTPIEQVLKLMQPVFVYHGVRLQTEFSSKAELQIDYVGMTKAIDAFLRFLIDQLPSRISDDEGAAVPVSHEREIRLKSFDDIEGSKICIEYYRKIDSSIIEKALDPVGQTEFLIKNNLTSTVLPLSAAQGLVMAQGGILVFRYEPHFQIIIKFNKEKEVSNINSAMENEVIKAQVVKEVSPSQVVPQPVAVAPLSPLIPLEEPVQMPYRHQPVDLNLPADKSEVDLDELLAVPSVAVSNKPLVEDRPISAPVAVAPPEAASSSEPALDVQAAHNTAPSSDHVPVREAALNGMDAFKVSIRKPTKKVGL